jgi:hypothetical protein
LEGEYGGDNYGFNLLMGASVECRLPLNRFLGPILLSPINLQRTGVIVIVGSIDLHQNLLTVTGASRGTQLVAAVGIRGQALVVNGCSDRDDFRIVGWI